jgi:hypothetical protein
MMYAPTFPDPRRYPKPTWHKVHPLALVRAACNTGYVLNCTIIKDEIPEGERYCSRCARLLSNKQS